MRRKNEKVKEIKDKKMIIKRWLKRVSIKDANLDKKKRIRL